MEDSLVPKERCALHSQEFCTLLFEEEEEDMYSDVVTSDMNKLWENGLVPFVFDDNVTPELKGFVIEAMQRICSVSFVLFVERTDEKDYIKIKNENRFSSYVGMKGGKQKLFIAEGWTYPIGRIMHELMHALGFHHEHCRPDRDDYVEVRRTDKNYKKFEESKVLCFGPYDLESIMHYSKKQGVMSRPGINAEIGQREKLSSGDINALINLYPEKAYGVMYNLTKECDIYSLDVLFWQLTSCKSSFESETEISLKIRIINGKREIPISNTNVEFVKLYQRCWEFKPDDRIFPK